MLPPAAGFSSKVGDERLKKAAYAEVEKRVQ
jgi:hypothetical protein